MKTPRVADFDPNAPAPTLHSAMDGLPPIRPPQQRQDAVPVATNGKVQEEKRPAARPERPTPVAPTQAPAPVIGEGFDINAERDARGTFELTAHEYDLLS